MSARNWNYCPSLPPGKYAKELYVIYFSIVVAAKIAVFRIVLITSCCLFHIDSEGQKQLVLLHFFVGNEPYGKTRLCYGSWLMCLSMRGRIADMRLRNMNSALDPVE